MAEPLITITKATPAVLDKVLSLLRVVDLPHEGVKEHFEDFLVAVDGIGKIIGCIGLERHAKIGLLRSLAVHPDYQRHKIGTRLTYALLDIAAKDNLTEMVLLTTTAKDFFAKVFGFREANRTRYNQALKDSPEWTLPRCSTAVFMKLALGKSK
ncbi:MAG: GNAT family N-acetyltransferase [Blastocatellia bacterium]|nr:GNAT family N-acetyltransferase [Blastocatellia bacterium]